MKGSTKSGVAKGFTLIELLVVIAIIGILSSIVLASLNTARLKARDARRVADIKQVQLALQLYFDSVGTYPATLSLLATTYIATIPTDPVGQVAYPYDQLTAGTSYHIGANLEDGLSQALNSDQDTTSATVTGADAGNCAVPQSPFGTSARRCYDLGP